jgi:Rad3-related DNA helicase
MSQYILNFPEGFSPRDNQTKALKAIENAFSSGKKFVILQASTGIGKTHISKTMGNLSKDVPDMFKTYVDDYRIYGDDGSALMDEFQSFGCYALTITKSLQDQYQTTFNDTGILKGQGNYQCDVDPEMSVDVAPCIYVKGLKNDCWKACRCPYYNARNNMMSSKFSALNYSMFFSLPQHLKKREIMVCDEGSELEDQLVSQFTCEIDFGFLMKTKTPVSSFPIQETSVKVLSWLQTLSVNVEKNIESYKDWFKENSKKISS